VSRTIDPGKGSKRKVREVGWTRTEVISAILLLLVLAGESRIQSPRGQTDEDN
jgi:hypothetical protein